MTKRSHRLMCQNKGAYGNLIIVELVRVRDLFKLCQMSNAKREENEPILATSLVQIQTCQLTSECRNESSLPIF
jgi:hypothetical protein